MNAALAYFLFRVLQLLSGLVGLTEFVVIVGAILSWLIAFDVLNARNRTVYQIVTFLDRINDRLLYPIRRFMPNLGGIDVSPIIYLFLAEVLKAFIASLERLLINGVDLG